MRLRAQASFKSASRSSNIFWVRSSRLFFAISSSIPLNAWALRAFSMFRRCIAGILFILGSRNLAPRLSAIAARPAGFSKVGPWSTSTCSFGTACTASAWGSTASATSAGSAGCSSSASADFSSLRASVRELNSSLESKPKRSRIPLTSDLPYSEPIMSNRLSLAPGLEPTYFCWSFLNCLSNSDTGIPLSLRYFAASKKALSSVYVLK